MSTCHGLRCGGQSHGAILHHVSSRVASPVDPARCGATAGPAHEGTVGRSEISECFGTAGHRSWCSYVGDCKSTVISR